MKIGSSLYGKILLGFFLLGVLPILIGSFLVYRSIADHLYQDIEIFNRQQAVAAGREIGRSVSEITDSLRFVAGQYVFQRPGSGLLNRVYRQYKAVRRLVVVDQRNLVTEALTRYGYLRPGMAFPLDDIASELPQQELKFFSQWRLEPQLVCLNPIRSLTTGKVVGYLFAEISMKTLFQEFPRQSFGGNRIYLVNEQGEVVADRNIMHVLNGRQVGHLPPVAGLLAGQRSALAEYRGLDGEMVVGVAEKIAGLPLLVVNEVPQDRAFALIRRLRHTFFGVVALSLLLILAGSWYLSRSMTLPLKRLFRATEKIRAGSFEPVAGSFPDDEVGVLAGCFNQMVESLRADRVLREAAEVRLRESEKRYRLVADYAYDMEYWRDPNGRFLHVSPSSIELTGFAPEDFFADKSLMQKLVLSEDKNIFVDHRHELEADEHFRPIEFRIRHRDGSIRWLSHICREVTGDDGEFLGIRGSNRDITDRKLAEEFLAAETERLMVTLRSIGDGVIATDNQARITLMNPVAEKLSGWLSGDAIGRPVGEVFRIIHERSRLPQPCPVTRVMQENRIVELANHTLLLNRHGEEIAIADSAAPIIAAQGKRLGAVLVFRDVREEKRRQEENLRHDKLEAVGLLAGGIAHDFNNLLMGLQGSLDLLRHRFAGDETAARYFGQADQAIVRAEKLARQLLTFAKGGSPVKEEVRLENLVRDSADFALHGTGCRISYQVAHDLWDLEIDAGQISQVINNLVTNARQAQNDAGEIEIFLDNFDNRDQRRRELAPGVYVRIEVADRGPGIEAADLPHIFEPYFTTKEAGNGLGLATCYSIVDNHNGLIEVGDRPLGGCSFIVFLPSLGRYRQVPGSDDRLLSPVALDFAEGKRILVMDDEPVIREVVSEMLALAGFAVTTVSEGRSLLAAYEEALRSTQPFAAVIMDLSIPGGMGGREAVKELLKIDPAARALVSSGYSEDPVMADYAAYGFVGRVAKPYKIDALLDSLRKALA